MKSRCNSLLRGGLFLTALLAPGLSRAASSEAILGLHPYLQHVQQDRAVITWTTLDSPGKGEVEFSQDGETWRRVVSAVKKLPLEVTGLAQDCYLHRAELGGLTQDTRYSYRVLIDGEPAAGVEEPGLFAFRTPGADSLRFLVLGDSGDGGAVQAEIGRHMAAEDADFVLHTGDLAYQDGTFQQFQDYFFGAYREMLRRMPFFAAPGNHEFYYRDGAVFRTLLGSPPGSPRDGAVSPASAMHYSFNWGAAHVVVLDTNTPLALAAWGDDAMLRWLDDDLKAAHGRWLIAVFHHTPFPIGHHKDSEPAQWARRMLVPILERHGVHLVLNGHEHLYMRSKPLRSGQPAAAGWGTVYVTSGGGGGVLHPVPEESEPFTEVYARAAHYVRVAVSGLEMKLQAVGEQGDVIDEFVIGAEARLAPGGVTDAAGFSTALAAGGLARLAGRDLSWGRAGAVPPLPEALGGVKVSLNGTALHLVSVARDRVVAQVPYGAVGQAELEMTGPNGTVRTPVRVDVSSPAILLSEPEEAGAALARHLDGRPVTEREPASPGEWVSIFLTGLGAVDPPTEAGLAPAGPHRPVAGVEAEAAGMPLTTGYCGLAEDLAGVYRLVLRVPAAVTGSLELQVKSAGKVSNLVNLPVR